MITHYDMTTGEVIGENQPDAFSTTPEVPAIATAQPRLLGVQETTPAGHRRPRLPADAALLPVPVLLARYS